MAKVVTIDLNKLKKSYSMKGTETVDIIGNLSFNELKTSGSTMTVCLTDGRKFKLTNISNPKGITFGNYGTLQDFYNIYPPEWLPEDEEKWAKFKTVTGTVFDDTIDVSDFYLDDEGKRTAGLTINGGAGDDNITGTDYTDTINGGAGDDTIEGGYANDKLTGGKGKDTFVFSYGDGVDTITDADVNDNIEVRTDSASLRYAKNGSNLEIFYDETYDVNDKIIVKNYFKTKATNRVEDLYTFDTSEDEPIKISAAIKAPIDPEDPESMINLAISGSGKINGTDNSEIVIGSAKADTINAKGGDDIIIAGLGNDKITGGKGKNTYSFKMVNNGDDMVGFGKDTVTLTATEDAILDFSTLELYEEDFNFSFDKNNLVIKAGEVGKVSIANFKKSDATGENGSILLKISDDEEEGIIDLKTKLFHTETTKDYKGAWYSEDIDATKATKGLKITAGKGNDVISVNNIGGNTYVFNLGDGADTIVNAQASDVIQFESKDVNFTFQKTEETNGLQIFYTDKDSVTINGYFDTENPIDKIKVKNGKKYDEISIKEVAIIDVVVDDDYKKESNLRENLIIQKVLENPIEVSGLKSSDRITLVDVPDPDDDGDDGDDNGTYAPNRTVERTLTLLAPRTREDNEPVFSRIDDGGLIINDSIILTDFMTESWKDFDIYYDNTHINTSNAVINVELNGGEYTATRYDEIFSGTGTIKNIDIDHDALNMDTEAEAFNYSRIAGSDDVTITDGENEFVIDNFFKLNGEICFADGTTSVDAIINVELIENAYVCSDRYAEIITGIGNVSNMNLEKDKILIDNEEIVFSRTNDGALVIDDAIAVTDFNFDGEHDIKVNDITTEGMMIKVTLTDNFSYTATSYEESFRGCGTIISMDENDKIVFEDGSDLEYTLTSSGLEISDGEENNIIVGGHTSADISGVNVYVGEALDDVSNKTLIIDEAPVIEISSETSFKDYAVKFDGVENFIGFNFRCTPETSQTSLFIDYQKKDSTGTTEFKQMEIQNYFTEPNVVSDKAPKTFILENGENSHAYTLEWKETLIEGTYSMFNIAESEEDYVKGVSHWIEGEGEITGVGANDVLIGSDGEDTITSSFYGAQIYGAKGDDTITGGGYADIFFFKVGDGEDEITNADEGDSIYIGNKEDEQEIQVEFVLYEQKPQDGHGEENQQGGTLKIKYGYADNLNDTITVPFDLQSERNIDEVYVWDSSIGEYRRLYIEDNLVYGVELNEGDRYDASQVQYKQEITLNGGNIELCGLSDKVTIIMDGDEPNPQLTLSRHYSQDSKDTLFINDNELKITDYFDGNEQHRQFRLSHGELPNTLAVTLDDERTVYQTEKDFAETISGRGMVEYLGENDVLDIDAERRKYRRTAGSEDVKILGKNSQEVESEITVINFFKNGDVTFADGTSSETAIIVVDLNKQEYYPTEYQEIYTGSGVIGSITREDNAFWFKNSDAYVKFALSEKSGLMMSDDKEGAVITVKQYDSKDNLTVYTGDNFDEVIIYDKTLYVSGFEQFDGTAYPFREYSITGTDKGDNLTGDEYDDVFEGGKGDDILTGGSGENKYIYHAGDGDDTIYGTDGAEDTLVFDEGTQVSAKYSDDNYDLLVTYSSGGSENTITISGYSATENVQWVQIGETVKSIDDYISGGGGEPQEIHITKDDMEQTYTLKKGDNIVIFDDAPMLGYGNILQSENTAGNGYTDTLDFTGISQMGEDITFMDNTLLIYGSSVDDVYTNDLWLDATAFQGCPGEGDVFYKNFYSDSAPNVVVIDNDRSYTAKGYNLPQRAMQLENDDVDRLIAIKADNGWNNIVSNKNSNVIYSFGGACLSYEYGGGQDNVTSLEFNTSDVYTVDYTNDVSLNIIDRGGDNDILSVSADISDMRILFNISKNQFSDEWECTSDHIILTKEYNISEDMLSTSTLPNAVITGGINLVGEMESVSIGTASVDISNWCDQIKSNVASWLTENGYDSVYEVFNGENPYDGDDIDTLIGYYDVEYVRQ